ncbi:ABC transporter ATP-binding protein [Variovorax sp. M-6]|uniref:ABC transporter ATP-binding protein n=1 Tax=Variovorax sp. M-6 TaxID=3233041 RepID=UPI003F9618DC
MLDVEDLHVQHGPLQAVAGVTLRVGRGEVVGVIGPNGAGKSTLMAAIAGGIPSRRGAVRLDGQAITGLRADRIARLGLTLVPEGRHVFGMLSVQENLRIGSYMHRDARDGIEHVLDYFPRLRERLHMPAGRLSGGEQQMLVIGRALLTRPRLMMIDEPSLGLAPRIVDQVYELLLQLREREGLSLLVNEQSATRLLRAADRVYVLREGRVRLQGHAAELRQGDALARSYFGHADAGTRCQGAAP